MNANNIWCGLHYNQKRCECNYHCTGCPNVYGPRRDNCCTCCEKRGMD